MSKTSASDKAAESFACSDTFEFTGQSGQPCFVDIHCHCLPAVDDGPSTISESLDLCRAMADDGITRVIATPHQLGRFNGFNEAVHIRQAVCQLNKELEIADIALTVIGGADVRVDERIPQLLKSGHILTLADGGKYILLELPHQVFIDIEPLLDELLSMGIQSVISHPERHVVLANQHEVLLKWLEYSAYLQITAASLLGEFGLMAQKAAWHLLSSGYVSLVATDAHHANERGPRMSAAFERIRVKLGRDVARLVCIENPQKVLNGEDLETVLPRKSREMKYERAFGNS